MGRQKIPAQIDELNLPIELLIVFYSARTFTNCVLSKTIASLLTQITEWDYVRQFAEEQGVLSLLVHNLNRTVPDIVSKTVLTDAKGYASRNLFLLIRLREIASLFNAHGIRAISYKGPTLGGIVYKNQSLRISGDLDFLVHARDYKRVKTLLLSEGYILHIDCGYKYHFWHPTKYINSDIHRNLVLRWYGFEFIFDQAWERCIPFVMPFGEPVPTFCFEDLFIALCLDLVKDIAQSDIRLIKVTDIAEFLTNIKKINWNAATQKAGDMRLGRVVYFGLLLAHWLYDIPFPPDVRQKPQLCSLLRPLADLTMKMIFHDKRSDRGTPPRILHELRTVIIFQDRIGDKLKVVIYYLVRPVRLVLKYLCNASAKGIFWLSKSPV
jgi:hypothetical protein